jgi:hypothetical protein
VASGSKAPVACWICGKAVSLEACVVDEHGMAVHENCSVAKIASKAKSSPPQEKGPPKPSANPPGNWSQDAAPELFSLTLPHLNLPLYQPVAFAGRLFQLHPMDNSHIPARVGDSATSKRRFYSS